MLTLHAAEILQDALHLHSTVDLNHLVELYCRVHLHCELFFMVVPPPLNSLLHSRRE